MPPPPNTTYKTFILAGERFTLGDNVMIKSGEASAKKGKLTGHSTDFIGKLEKIHTDSVGEVNLDLRWYYRPEETKIGRKAWHGAFEVLESDHKDTCHVGSVNSKCLIYTFDEWETMGFGAKKAKSQSDNQYNFPEFFYRSKYDHKKGRLEKELPVYCFCETPQNPDDLLLACDKCERWFHLGCVNVAEKDVSTMKRWFCYQCEGNSAKKRKHK